MSISPASTVSVDVGLPDESTPSTSAGNAKINKPTARRLVTEEETIIANIYAQHHTKFVNHKHADTKSKRLFLSPGKIWKQILSQVNSHQLFVDYPITLAQLKYRVGSGKVIHHH